ncbi:F-actin-uncapping protein LRRC16A-like isoform X2 [Lates japonicus]|uniref:F-actin-uncapping protein LRRC16A-like isoform X2 n=1 Tax=Lates japonicus TaxID=270547 RepID=A0AAD3R8Y7_LATJO|nr:F-actin-uncapping protein LRRC16A-like isoform X2 [Lates japonicus]
MDADSNSSLPTLHSAFLVGFTRSFCPHRRTPLQCLPRQKKCRRKKRKIPQRTVLVSFNLVADLLSVVESVREAVGRRVKLTLRLKVQLEVKGDKVEKRVLLSDSCSFVFCVL